VQAGYISGARGFDALLVGVYERKQLDLRRKGEEWQKNPLVIHMEPFIIAYGQWLVRNQRSETLV
jgi:hypothetical protein